ncbi:hypothetical protein [Acetobacter sp. UBA5411]|uniref:hypothetical protein n=1 Tax=Acetobacter sp. UBA5411 TaxID=1945905 RepID=UPI0025C33A3B|nr:hypothetical protein [Acetobacter sp. UBA5411]
MSAIVKLPTRAAELSPALSAAIAHRSVEKFGSGEDGVVIRVGEARLTQVMIDEAARALPSHEAAMKPLDGPELQAKCEELMDMLAGAAAMTPDDKTLGMRTFALVVGCEDIPRVAFGDGLLRDAVKRFKFFPSVAEIVDFLNERCAAHRDQLARLKIIARSKPTETPTRQKPSPEERAAVAAKLEALRAEKSAQAAQDAAIDEFGSWTPEGAENLSGDALAAFLEGLIPTLDGPKREVTEMRIVELRKSAAMMRQVLAMSEGARA